jgi:hypothetical protein
MSSELQGKMVNFCLLPSQSPFDLTHSLSISNFGHLLLADLTKLGHFSYLPRGWFQISRNSPRHGEAWGIIGRKGYHVQ